MPIGTVSQIQNAILAITDPAGGNFPATQADAVQMWADVADALLMGVIPPTLTAAAGRAAFIGVLSPATPSNPIGAALLEAAFVAYAGVVAGGMSPTYAGVPPVAPPGISALLASPVPDALPVAISMATALTIWAKTGTATLVAPPFTVLLWN